MKVSFAGKVILVVGGTGGLGKVAEAGRYCDMKRATPTQANSGLELMG